MGESMTESRLAEIAALLRRYQFEFDSSDRGLLAGVAGELLAEVRRLQTDLALADRTAAAQLAEVRRLTAEVERMRPVVAMAESIADRESIESPIVRLRPVVDAYRKAKP